MFKPSLMLSTTIGLALLFVSCTDYTVIPITNDDNGNFQPEINDNGWVVWQTMIEAEGGTSIFLYDGTSTTQIASGSVFFGPSNPDINNDGWVVWNDWDGSDYDIFLYDGKSTTNISNNDYADCCPQISDSGYVVWEGSDGTDGEIYLYDGTTVMQLTSNDTEDMIWYRLSSDWLSNVNDSGSVVWQGCDGGTGSSCSGGDWEIFLYDGIGTTQLTNNSHNDWDPQINDEGEVIWGGGDSSDGEIFLYDGMSTTNITNNDFDDWGPRLNDNGWVVWRGCVEGPPAGGCYTHQLFLYDGTSTTQITDVPPSPSGTTVMIESLDISNNGDVVCVTNSGISGEDTVFLYDGISTIALSRLFGWNLHSCISNARINNDGKVVYEADGNLFIAKPLPGYSATANAQASAYGSGSLAGSGVINALALLVVPVGAVIAIRFWRRKG